MGLYIYVIWWVLLQWQSITGPIQQSCTRWATLLQLDALEKDVTQLILDLQACRCILYKDPHRGDSKWDVTQWRKYYSKSEEIQVTTGLLIYILLYMWIWWGIHEEYGWYDIMVTNFLKCSVTNEKVIHRKKKKEKNQFITLPPV